MLFTSEHEDVRRSLQKFIASDINPYVDESENADIFLAHELFKKLGDLGFLGLNKPVEFRGQGLDCLQFWGGMGFMNETPVSRAYRDSHLTSIGGADEVMLMVLC